MAGGTKPQSRAAPERYPGRSLSVTEALHAVSMKLSQVAGMRCVRRRPLVGLSQKKKKNLCLVKVSAFLRFASSSREFQTYLTLGSDPISRARNV